MKLEKKDCSTKDHDVMNEKLPVQKLGVLGLQHVLVMYSGAVIVPLILGAAINLSAADIAFLISPIYSPAESLHFYKL